MTVLLTRDRLMDFAYRIRMTFGTSPHEPSRSQVFCISSEAVAYAKSGNVLDAAKWSELVKKHCPSAGQWVYKGLDNSDIRTLLALATQITEGRAE